MAQLNFDWVVGHFHRPGGDLATLNPGGVSTAVFKLIDEFDLEDKEDTLRVERVVGSVLIMVSPSTEFPSRRVHIAERIYVTEVDDLGDTPLFHNLFSPTDFDRSFLWERRTLAPDDAQVGHCATGTEPCVEYSSWVRDHSNTRGKHPFWSQIDCRVARRLKDREVLVYQVSVSDFIGQTGDAEEFPNTFIMPWLRVGVKF